MENALSIFSNKWLLKLASIFGKTLYQKKFITGTHTTAAIVPELYFNNLEIGKRYRVTGKLEGSSTTGVLTNKQIYGAIYNGAGNNVESFNARSYVESHKVDINIDKIFTAEATTLYCQITTIASMQLFGNTINHTFLILEELPNHEETTKWT